MTQENRQGIDQLMKAFDAAQAAQKHFAESGNIEGAQIAQQASNKIYLSIEAAMRTCKRGEQGMSFGDGGRMVQVDDRYMSMEADTYAQGGRISEEKQQELIDIVEDKIGPRNDIEIEDVYFDDDPVNPSVVLEYVFLDEGSEDDYQQIITMAQRWLPTNGRIWEDGFEEGQDRYRVAFGVNPNEFKRGGKIGGQDRGQIELPL